MSCQASRYNDQMVCQCCGTQWDINDPDPPLCMGTVKTEGKEKEALKVFRSWYGIDLASGPDETVIQGLPL